MINDLIEHWIHYTLNIHYIINYNINKYIYYTYISVYTYMSLSAHHRVKEINSVQFQFPDMVMKKLPVQNIQQGRLKNNFQQITNNPQSEDQKVGSCYFTDKNKPHPLNSKCLFTGTTCEICFNSLVSSIYTKRVPKMTSQIYFQVS